MSTVVPPRFLFRWSFPVAYWPTPPKGDALPELPDAYALPALSGVDGQTEFAAWRLGWHEQGLALDITVTGKTKPVRCEPQQPGLSSGIHVWLDTRATQNVHRATRFCHRFALLPSGSGRNRQQPIAVVIPLGQPSEEKNPKAAVRIASQLHDDGYRLRAWFPADSLTGYDPESQPRLGFYGVVLDDERGTQALTVGDEFPYQTDPSLWQTLELVR